MGSKFLPPTLMPLNNPTYVFSISINQNFSLEIAVHLFSHECTASAEKNLCKRIKLRLKSPKSHRKLLIIQQDYKK